MTSAAKNYALTIDDLIVCVSEYCGVFPGEIIGPCRHPRACIARRIVVVLTRAHTLYTYADLSRNLNNRTHSTLIQMVQEADRLVEQGKMFRDCGDLVTLSDLFVRTWDYCQKRRHSHTKIRDGCVEPLKAMSPVPRVNELGRELVPQEGEYAN